MAKVGWLNEQQISELVTVCHDSYEMQCDWGRAKMAAAEYSIDEWGVAPSLTATLLVYKRAKTAWHGTVMKVKKENKKWN